MMTRAARVVPAGVPRTVLTRSILFKPLTKDKSHRHHRLSWSLGCKQRLADRTAALELCRSRTRRRSLSSSDGYDPALRRASAARGISRASVETLHGESHPLRRHRRGHARSRWTSKNGRARLPVNRSNETHFVGLSFEGAAARRSALAVRRRRTTRTFASRKVFSPTHMSPEKMIKTLFAPAGANSARHFSTV